MRRTWGETLAGKMGLGLVIFLTMLPGMALVMLGIVLGGASGQPVLAGVGFAIGVVWILGVSLVSSAVQSILLTALYLYASEGTAPPQFDAALLRSAFGSKR
jgi:membrane protein implicated in regulation of membrane protease activity